MSENFLFLCREAARVCPDILVRKLLKDATDELQSALKLLAAVPTQANMQVVVAFWTKAHIIFLKAQPLPDPAPRSGAGESERMAA